MRLTALSAFIALIQRWRLDYERVRDVALEVNLRHLYTGSWVLALLNLGHVLFFGFFWTFESAAQQQWAYRIAVAHALMGAFMSVMHGLLQICLSAEEKPKWSAYLPELMVIVAFVWAIVLTVVDLNQGFGLNAYQNACAATALVVLLRPLFAGILFSGAAMLMVGALHCMALQGDLFSNQLVNVVTASALALLVAVLLWRRFVQTELLQQTLAQTNELLRQQQAELEALATTDSLTGLMNRRALIQRAEIELRRVKREATPLSVLMVDIDHFKHVNDQWGHAAGDAVLQHIAGLMQGAVRETDAVARLGGEEFALLLSGAPQNVAYRLAEQLRIHIAETTLRWAGSSIVDADVCGVFTPIQITISIGVISLPSGREATIDTLLNLADQALYRAKYLGRNRVEIAMLI